MKKLLLLITLFLFLGCEKEEVVLEQVFEISLDGESFNPYERYAKIVAVDIDPVEHKKDTIKFDNIIQSDAKKFLK